MKRLRNFFLRYIDLIQILLAILAALPALYLLLLSFDLPIPYIQLSDLHTIILISGELLIITWLYQRHFIRGSGSRDLFVRDFLILNCLFIYPFFVFYRNPYRAGSPTFELVKPYLTPVYLGLLALSALSARKDLQRLNQWLVCKIDEGKQRDIATENRRKEQLKVKVPNGSKIAVPGNLFTKIFSVGTLHIYVILLLAACGLILRLWNLDVLPPYTDEYRHLLTAKALAEGSSTIDQIAYRRSLYTVTLPVALSYHVFGVSLWNARGVGVLFSILALIPLYLLTKRINRAIAVLAVGLYALSPWMIAISRNVREYAVFPLFFYLVALGMTVFYENFPEKFVFTRDFRSVLTWKNLLLLSFLVFILYFIAVVDFLSTLKVILVLYPIFGLLLLRKLEWNDQSNQLLALVLIVIAVISTGWLLQQIGGRNIALNTTLNANFVSLFYEKPAQQWYFNRPFISLFILALALLATTFKDHKKFVLPFSVLVYATTLLSFSVLTIKGNRPRYIISAELWHIILMAVGLYAAYRLAGKIFDGRYRWVIWLGLLLFFWNIPQTFVPALHSTPGVHPVTNENHADYAPVYNYLQMNVAKEDVLVISKYFGPYVNFYGGFDLRETIQYSSTGNAGRQIMASAIETFPRGWMVVDKRFKSQLPLEDFTHKGIEVLFVGELGDAYLYYWPNN